MEIQQLVDSHKWYSGGYLDKGDIISALDVALEHIDNNIKVFGENFPEPCTVQGKYPVMGNTEWTNGFWTGILWLAYEYSGKEKYRLLAENNVNKFTYRIDNMIEVNHHDLGFLYSPSVVAGYKLTKSKDMLETGIKAANQLLTRYNPQGKFIQAWGNKGETKENRLIIDALLNIPLLYWATDVTGDRKYRDVADNHYASALKTVFREDGSTYHTYFFDEKGKPLHGATRQGYSDDSFWARGQAWGIYGTALHYYDTKDAATFDVFKSVLNFYLNRLPDDSVPYWDMIFTDGSGQSRDSSAAAIAVCGIHEMLKYLPECDSEKNIYRMAMNKILQSLIKNYAVPSNDETSTPLILHGVYSWHSSHGIDEGTIWGDYYYMEALVRFYKDWNLYW